MERTEPSNQKPHSGTSCRTGVGAPSIFNSCPRVNFRHEQLQNSRLFGLPHQQRAAKRGNVRLKIDCTRKITKTFTHILTTRLRNALHIVYNKFYKTFAKHYTKMINKNPYRTYTTCSTTNAKHFAKPNIILNCDLPVFWSDQPKPTVALLPLPTVALYAWGHLLVTHFGTPFRSNLGLSGWPDDDYGA